MQFTAVMSAKPAPSSLHAARPACDPGAVVSHPELQRNRSLGRPPRFELQRDERGAWASRVVSLRVALKDSLVSAAKDPSRDPDARLESVGQADPALREGPVSRGRLTLIIVAVIVVLVWMWWALVGTHKDIANYNAGDGFAQGGAMNVRGPMANDTPASTSGCTRACFFRKSATVMSSFNFANLS
jgi:hypothetical protein